MIRNIVGGIGYEAHKLFGNRTGAFFDGPSIDVPTSGSHSVQPDILFDASRVVPVGNANKSRAFGVLPCVYLGTPK